VRSALLVLFVSLLAASVHAQTTQQERKLYDRIMHPDETKAFDPRTAAFTGPRSFSAKSAQGKDFHFEQRFAPGEYRTKDFAGSKGAWMGAFKFATSSAQTKGDYQGPNAGKTVDTKGAATKEARESSKTMAVRELPGANRTYLGPEADRVKKALDPANLPKVSNDLKELKSVEDIRELLNKNK
jgi:hypothetical protein